MPKYRVGSDTYTIPPDDIDAITAIENVDGVEKLDEEVKSFADSLLENQRIRKTKSNLFATPTEKSNFKKEDFKDLSFIDDVTPPPAPFDTELKKTDIKVGDLYLKDKKNIDKDIKNNITTPIEKNYALQSEAIGQIKKDTGDSSNILNLLIFDNAANEEAEQILNFDDQTEAEILNVLKEKNIPLQKVSQGRLSLEEKNQIITQAKANVLNNNFKNEINKTIDLFSINQDKAIQNLKFLDNELKALSGGDYKMDLYDAPNRIKAFNDTVKQYNTLLNSSKENQKNYNKKLENLQAKYIIEQGDLLTKNFDKLKLKDKEAKEAIDMYTNKFGSEVADTRNAVFTLINEGYKLIKKAGIAIPSLAIDVLDTSYEVLTGKDETYTMFDAFNDQLALEADISYIPTMDNYSITDEKGNLDLTYGNVINNMSQMLPFSLYIMYEARKGNLDGAKKLVSKAFPGSGKLGNYATNLKVTEAAFKATLVDNIKEGERLGLNEAQSRVFGFNLSLAEGLTSIFGIEKGILKPNINNIKRGLFTNLAKETTKKGLKNAASNYFLKNPIREIAQEELMALTGDVMKVAAGISSENNEFTNIVAQKQLITSSAMLSYTLGLPGLSNNYKAVKGKIYNEIFKESNNLFKDIQEQIENLPRNEAGEVLPEYQESLKELNDTRIFIKDLVRAVNVSPKNVSSNDLDLIIQKERLLREKGKLDSAFHGPINEKIEEINKQIEESNISKSKKEVGEKIAKGAKAYAKKIGADFQQLTQQEVDELIANDPTIDKEAGEQYGFFYTNKEGNMVLVENTDQSSKDGIITTGAHETVHAILSETVKNNPEAAIKLGQALKTELGKIDINNIKNSEFKQRLYSYLADDSITDAQAWEEALTLFSEAALTGDIKYDNSLGGRLKDLYNSFLKAIGFKGQFDTGRDVYNFIKKFNKSLLKGEIDQEIIDIAEKGATGKLIDEVDIKNTKDTKQRKGFSKNINELAQQYTTDTNNKQLEKDLIDQYESVAVAALGYDVRRGTVAPEEALSFVRSQFKSIIDRFDPTKAAFTTHVNANIVPKRQQFYDQLIGDEALTTSIDAPESRQIADTTPEVETTTVIEDKKPTTNPLKLFGLDEKAKTNFVEKTVKELKKLDVSELTYKTLRTLDEQGIADLVGIPAKKIFSPAANLSQPEARKALMFINKNARAIINLLPENNTEVKEVEAKNKPGKKVPIGGLPTGVPRNIQKLFYNKGKRIGNNFQFTKKKDITVESFKKALGIEGNVKSPTFKVRSSTSQALKGMLELIGRAATNTAARQYLQEIGTDPRIIENIKEGKNPVMFSKKLNQGLLVKFSQKLTSAQIESTSSFINEIFDKGITSVYNDKGVVLPEYKNKIPPEIAKSIYEEIKFGDFADFEKASYSLFIKNNKNIPKEIKDKFLNSPTFKNDKKQKDALVKDVNVIAKTLGKPLMDFLKFDVFGFYNRALDPAEIKKDTGKPGEYYNALQKIVKSISNTKSDLEIQSILNSAKKMNKAFPLFKKVIKIQEGKFGKTKKEKLKALKKLEPEIEAANIANIKIATFIGQKLNELYRDKKISAESVLRIFQLQTSTTGGLRALTRLSHVSIENGIQKGNKKGEHLAPNANTMAEIVGFILDPKLDLKQSNDLIETAFATHDQWLTTEELTDIIDKKGGKNNTSKERRLLFLDAKDLQNVYSIDGNPFLLDLIIKKSEQKAAPFNNEKLPSVVKFSKRQDYTNNMVLGRMAELDLEQAEAQMKFSKSQNLSDDFNKIIENKTGIGAEKVYSDVKAQVVGASKGRFNFFIPPSAEDFMGLLYKTLGKGKLGDAQMAWYKKNLLDPFARAMDNISRDRIALQNDFKKLKQDLKIVPKNLRKKITGEPYTQEQAVRVYIWNLQGMRPEGMSQTDINELVSFVESKPELVTFANELIRLQKGDSYPAPKFGWLAGTITTDLMDGINTIKRAKYLEQWQYNVDEIFSRANLNKLEAAYGKNYRVALEGILKRMRTGRNREFNSDTLTGRVTDWLTNSIGAIMFFNTRSAVLQTISAVNFINFKDNNIFAAGKAFANQPQFWKDFMTLMNSDFLVDRRNGLRLNVNENDIADMAKKGGVRGVISEMLRLGFLPTQIADSFAIASGGATFYRNRIKSLQKQGKSKAEAEKEAFLDFREIAEESQQSSRPDRISQQQASPLGRIILAFANTPMQYTRLIKKAASDLKNGRGDAKTNISKIFYYGFAQNLLFNAMQQALFAIGFGDDDETSEEKEKKKQKKYISILNSMADSILRGLGVGGAIVSVLKNTATKLYQESDKKRPEYQDVVVKEILQISPPISSKVGKIKAAFRTYSWNKKEIMEKGFSLDNPAYLAAGQLLAASFNIPLDRAFKKIENIRNASNSDYEAWARIAMLAGWADWELGVKPKQKLNPNIKRKTIKTRSKKAKSRSKTIEIRKK